MSISRRDFVNGVAVSITALACQRSQSEPDWDAGYPPSLRGLQGQTDAAAAVGHSLFDGNSAVGESTAVDAVIVGAGVSGLAAAHFYRERFGTKARILILDPAEDFGGHARRNEFRVDGRSLIGYAGSESLQSPRTLFSATALKLLTQLGVDVSVFERGAFDRRRYPDLGLSRASFFRGGRSGKAVLVPGDPTTWVSDDIPPDAKNAETLEAFVGAFPINERARAELIRLWRDPAPLALRRLTAEATVSHLETRSYERYLREDWALSEEAVQYLRQRPLDFFGLSTAHIPALDAAAFSYPGFVGLHLSGDAAASADVEDPYIYHFPDGNATIARALVASLRPDSVRVGSIGELVNARVAYGRLGDPSSNPQILLGHAAVRVDPVRAGVSVTYRRVGESGPFARVEARHCVLACFSAMASRLTPAFDPRQHEALRANERVPLVYANVAVRNWKPWQRLGIHDVFGVDTFFSKYKLDYPVSLGAHRFSEDPSQPILLHLVHVPYVTEPSDVRAAIRAGRRQLMQRSFADFEHAMRDELSALLGPGGFEFDRDVAGITVNRWAHGYSWQANTLSDSASRSRELLAEARRPLGAITVAGSDAGWSQYLDGAIDEAARAVNELS